MTTIKRFTPDYKMHAVRFEAFAREAEHGEFVKFSDYEALVSELASSRQINAQTLQIKLTMAETIKELTDRVNALAVENQALIEGLRCIYTTALIAQDSGSEILYSWDFSNQPAEEIEMWISGAKETDAALAAIQAQGVEKAAEYTAHESSRAEFINSDISSAFAGLADDLIKLANELREAK